MATTSKSNKTISAKNSESQRLARDDYYIDPRRPWLIVSDDGKESAVLMAKDIEKLTQTISSVREIDDIKAARKTFKQFLELIDFAPVTIDEKRQVRWKQGKFSGNK